MAAPTVGDRIDDDDRLHSMQQRLDLLRRQTDALLLRTSEAAERSREARAASGTCNHGREVEQMRTAVHELEHELEGLRTAMNTRGVIEQAKGMVMLQKRCDADAAFALLAQLSQTSHRKLVDVARAVVETWSNDGAP